MKCIAPFCLLLALSALATLARAEFDDAAATYRDGDYAGAFNEFIRLARAGDPRAQTVVAMMYKYGEAVEQDWATAFGWYEKAAASGYVPAQYAMGEMYADGRGIAEDRTEAVHWLTLAAKGGYAKANEKLKELNAHAVAMDEAGAGLISWSEEWLRATDAPAAAANVTVSGTPDEPGDDHYRVQLAAMHSLEAARAMWEELASAHADLVKGKEPRFRRRDVATGTFYALQTGPYPTLGAARLACEAFRNVGLDCFPLRAQRQTD